MQDIIPKKRNGKPDRVNEVKSLRDGFIVKVYSMQYTIKEIGAAFNMSHQNVWKIIVREKNV